ncbi:MATE family efflux transporter [Streptomyces sp. NPDC088812]|uniref:MATE family efflux transporter n=1 Tax=Streptomyces sp. NPDC088812 TaxID=3365905 RepID=UPI0037FE00E3
MQHEHVAGRDFHVRLPHGTDTVRVEVTDTPTERVPSFAVMPQTGMSQGLQPIVGYNAGRGLDARVARTRALALRASLVYGAATAILLTVLAEPLVGIFVSGGEAAEEAGFALCVIAVGGIVIGIAPLVSAYFQALGRPLPAYVLTIGSLILLKAPLVVMCGLVWGTRGVWFGLASGEFATAASALLLLHRVDRRTPIGCSDDTSRPRTTRG